MFDLELELEQIVKDFQECSSIVVSMDMSKVPLELQLKMAVQTAELTSAIKKFNKEVKNLIVLASIATGNFE